MLDGEVMYGLILGLMWMTYGLVDTVVHGVTLATDVLAVAGTSPP